MAPAIIMIQSSNMRPHNAASKSSMHPVARAGVRFMESLVAGCLLGLGSVPWLSGFPGDGVVMDLWPMSTTNASAKGRQGRGGSVM